MMIKIFKLIFNNFIILLKLYIIMASLNSLDYVGNGVFDPNSNFYKWNKRNFPVFNRIPSASHLNDYNYNPQYLDSNYKDMFQERTKFTSGNDDPNKLSNMQSVSTGYSTNEIYYTLKDIQLEAVGFKFFTKKNMNYLQKRIKQMIYKKTNGKVIIEYDQDESDLLIAMRNIYVTEGRYIPENIDFQVERLNMRLLNKIVPDMITAIKQDWAYQKEINEPLHPIDRPISESSRGRKLLPSITSIWNIQK